MDINPPGPVTRLFLRNLGISAVLGAVASAAYWFYVREDRLNKTRAFYERLQVSSPSISTSTEPSSSSTWPSLSNNQLIKETWDKFIRIRINRCNLLSILSNQEGWIQNKRGNPSDSCGSLFFFHGILHKIRESFISYWNAPYSTPD
jgi:hypothetical protein